jgi:hypothetical protein
MASSRTSQRNISQTPSVAKVGMSLSDVCEKISEIATWKFNAHITSQRSSLEGKMVVDPAGVDTRRLSTTSPYIYLKQGAALNGVDRYIKQLQTVDVTAGVMDDIDKLKGLQEAISGWSAQMQGQYSAGRSVGYTRSCGGTRRWLTRKDNLGFNLGHCVRASCTTAFGEQSSGDGLRYVQSYLW